MYREKGSTKLDNTKITVLTYAIACLIILYIVEQVLMTPYIIKTIIRVPMFTLFPFMIQQRLLKSKISLGIKRSEQKYTLFWSIFVFVLIIAAAFFLKSFIDTEAISSDFGNRMQLSRKSMIIAGIYTIFVNSFIEEYFFRGFIFQELLKQGWMKSAYFISSAAFAIYHVSIIEAWFSLWLMLVMLLGLFAGGLLFAYFVKKTGSIVASWLIHVSADLALVLFGFLVLGL